MTIDEYKKQNTLHVELPSGLVFDAKAPSGLFVSRFYERISVMKPEQGLEMYAIMLQEFEHCFPEGLKLEDFTTEDYAALIGIASPFFAKNPYPSQPGSATNSEPAISKLDAGPTII